MILFCEKYQLELEEKLGSGSCGKPPTVCPMDGFWLILQGLPGSVFRAIDLSNDNRELVAKIDNARFNSRSLEHEHHVLSQLQGVPGIPRPIWFGTESGRNVLLLSSLGPSLEGVFNLCGRTFSHKTVAMIACQLVCSVLSSGFLCQLIPFIVINS
jgi:hypothetical protein